MWQHGRRRRAIQFVLLISGSWMVAKHIGEQLTWYKQRESLVLLSRHRIPKAVALVRALPFFSINTATPTGCADTPAYMII